jgi:hypothetical protein
VLEERIGQRPSSDRCSLDLYEVPVALPRPSFSFSLLKKKVRSGKASYVDMKDELTRDNGMQTMQRFGFVGSFMIAICDLLDHRHIGSNPSVFSVCDV